MIYNHWFVLLTTIELFNNFKMMFAKYCIFIIVFQFTIVISILWQLLKHDKMIEKTMSITQYTNLHKICSKLLHENKALINENSMLMNFILFFWFCFVFFFMWTRIVWLICVEMMKWCCDFALFLFFEKVFYFGVWF